MKTTNHIPQAPGARLTGKSIVLGVTGSIAAYKAASLARRLLTEGALVRVVMTHTAQRFVAPLTFEALTGQPVFTDLFASSNAPPTANVMPHLALADEADLIAIAPASAHCVASWRMASPTISSPRWCSRQSVRWCWPRPWTAACGPTRRSAPTC